MTERYLAHSAKGNIPAQSYEDHVRGVVRRAEKYAEEADAYASKTGGLLKRVVRQAALFHDLGKLDDKNQEILRDASGSRSPLAVNHADAGSAALKAGGDLYAALAVYSHHQGLPNFCGDEMSRGKAIFRDGNAKTREYVDATLDELLRRHRAIFPGDIHAMNTAYKGDQKVFFRMLLSCLGDADHTDTAVNYRQAPEDEQLPQLRGKERLEALDRYVSGLGDDGQRSKLRREMYYACRDSEVGGGFAACPSPVGTGKTMAVMAHLLRQAIRRGSRRIFVVLPYTSIIRQSVEEYRKALVLPGEDPKEVVAELHHRADFECENARYLTALWRAPIVVTTAVAFFETLASNRPSSLRRLHELPGSEIFVDEAHNALPLKLLPLAWRWMNTLAEEWGCYWVLASGSLVRYWELNTLKGIKMPRPNIPELVEANLQKRLMEYEQGRVAFEWCATALSRRELIERVQSAPGPQLLILNTVQSAAVIADDICKAYGRGAVEHLSTALTPEDREATIKRVRERLDDPNDTQWTLVSTSCVEAGVDFSFRTGFREFSSLLSLLQAAGRINRSGLFSDAKVWSFSLRDDSMLTKNNNLDVSREVLREYFKNGCKITPELSTKSMDDEIVRSDSCIMDMERFLEMEDAAEFKAVDSEFAVIESDTVTVVVDEKLARLIELGQGDWQLLQKKSVPIRRKKAHSMGLKMLADGLYQWGYNYDSFLGYMRGMLELDE